MKILKNKSILNKIYELNDINQLNMSLSEMYLSFVNNSHISSLLKSNDIDSFINKIKEIYDIYFEEQSSEEMFNQNIKNSIIKLNKNDYINNPYLKNINLSNIKVKNYELKNDKYKPFELFALKDIEISKDFLEHTTLGFFESVYSFPALNYNHITWMSIIPNEIETMAAPLSNSSGNILVLGLGLGYFPYMASLKKNVHSITIVENDQSIINLFTTHILPQFEQKDKIRIIKDDAYDYFAKSDKFDYIFADLWHNADDGIFTYLKLKNINKNIKVDYWLENSFVALLRRAFITLLFEQANDYKESNYLESNNNFDKLVNMYYKETINSKISSISQIEQLLEKESLLKLIIG